MRFVLLFMIALASGCAGPDSSENDKDRKGDTLPVLSKSALPAAAELATDGWSDSVITISVSYAAIECGCPQWFETRFSTVEFLDGVERFYLEPVSEDLINANDLWDGVHLPLTVKITGRFSRQKEVPGKFRTKGIPEKARIFRYEKITVVSDRYNY